MTCVRGEETIFSRVDLRAQAAEVVQLKGGNGSGKTSLLRLLCGIARPSAGTIRWNGTDIHHDPEDFRRSVGYVGHERAVCADLTPLENVQFANALGNPRPAAACRDALARVQLAHVAEIPTRLLSAGQNQRTALARLLVSHAALWFLDEPFTALDLEGHAIIEAMITQHAASGGISIIATHQPMILDGVRTSTVQLGSA